MSRDVCLKMMINMLARNHHRRDETVDEKGAQWIRREITVRLDAWTQGWVHASTRGWDGVGIMIAGTGWVVKMF